MKNEKEKGYLDGKMEVITCPTSKHPKTMYLCIGTSVVAECDLPVPRQYANEIARRWNLVYEKNQELVP